MAAYRQRPEVKARHAAREIAAYQSTHPPKKFPRTPKADRLATSREWKLRKMLEASPPELRGLTEALHQLRAELWRISRDR